MKHNDLQRHHIIIGNDAFILSLIYYRILHLLIDKAINVTDLADDIKNERFLFTKDSISYNIKIERKKLALNIQLTIQ